MNLIGLLENLELLKEVVDISLLEKKENYNVSYKAFDVIIQIGPLDLVDLYNA